MHACFECFVIAITCYHVPKLVILIAYRMQIVDCLKLSLKILEENLYKFLLFMRSRIWDLFLDSLLALNSLFLNPLMLTDLDLFPFPSSCTYILLIQSRNFCKFFCFFIFSS